MIRLLTVLALAAAAAASPLVLAIRPGSSGSFAAVVSGQAPGDASGAFSGSVALNGSPDAIPVRGNAHRSGGRLTVPLSLRYADIPADWANRFRPGALDVRLEGSVEGKEPVHWTASVPWNAIQVDGEKETVAQFVRLTSLELTRFSLFESEAQAVVSVRNPFSFPLKIAGASYTVFANDAEVGSGRTQGLLLHAGQDNVLDFPIEIEHGPMLAAAGSALSSGGQIDGRLRGRLAVRLPGGDIEVPLDLSGKFSLTE